MTTALINCNNLHELERNLFFSTKKIEPSMSNFDHSIDDSMAEELIAGECKNRSSHAGWNFFGYVWYEQGQFHELVMCYHEIQEVISAPTLDELMETVNNSYGWE